MTHHQLATRATGPAAVAARLLVDHRDDLVAERTRAICGQNERGYRPLLEADSARPRGGEGGPVTNPTHAG
jgi:hypothetical protein